MTTLWQDLRFAVRMLRKSPGFTAIALITLAIGIGANTIMFSVSDMILLAHARGVKDPEQLAYCAIRGVDDSSFRYSEYLALRDSGLAFRDAMAQITLHDRGTLVRGDSAWRVWMTYVSANFFSVLGATPIQGREFLPEEERPGSAPVAVLSYRCWQRLGGDPKLVGEFVSINGTACQVVGVAPEGFNGVSLSGSDLWLPLGSLRTVHDHYRSRLEKEPSFYVIGRLKPDVTMPVAQAQLQALVPRFKEESPAEWADRSSIYLRPPGREMISGSYELDRGLVVISLVLLTPAAIILVIACLNLANMLIVQGASRHREMAVRMALGGGRWRIIRQLLVESGLLGVLGGVLGVLVAFCGLRILNACIAAVPDEATALRLALNVRILAATLGLCLVAALLFGLRPALLLSKRDIAGEMKASGGSVLGSVRRKRGSLSVTGQIALAVALVLCATLLTRRSERRGRTRVSPCRTSWSFRSTRNRWIQPGPEPPGVRGLDGSSGGLAGGQGTGESDPIVLRGRLGGIRWRVPAGGQREQVEQDSGTRGLLPRHRPRLLCGHGDPAAAGAALRSAGLRPGRREGRDHRREPGASSARTATPSAV